MQRKYVLLAVVTLGVVVGDQITKYLTLKHLTTALESGHSFFGAAPEAPEDAYHYVGKPAVVISEQFLRLRYAENPGAAFGLFTGVSSQYRGPLFFLVTIGAVVLVVHYTRKLKGAKNERWARAGLPLVLGGAMGNFVDRLARSFVIDFLEVHWFDRAYWPAFNVADSAIVVGVLLLLVDSFVRPEEESK